MDVLDAALLARIQFAVTVGYHFIFVPLTIGIGLIMAIFATRAYRTGSADDDAIARMWVKIFTATFAIGVATGITMEFSFGTNWAAYSRFVGDIFGAPLAAEALFAFFLESVFLGVLLFGRKRVSRTFYLVSSWLVWFGSCLSALWILIANSWMQTPAGGVLSEDGTEAVITDFFAAALNPSIGARYFHVILALLVMGAFVTMAVAAWYMLKDRHQAAAGRMMRVGAVVGIIATCVLLVSAHASAVVVYEEQPTKLAMMEGQYETEVPGLYLFGWVDEENQELTGLSIPGGTSFLATGTWDTEYPGLNDLAEDEQFSAIANEDLPVNFVFQSYHIMVAMFAIIFICAILALVTTWKRREVTSLSEDAPVVEKPAKIASMRWLQWLLLISPVFPFIAIQTGWITAEVGRQPWVVYPSVTGPEGVSLLTADGISISVSSVEVLITLLLFIAVYLLLLIGWIRVICRFINKGPVYDDAATAGSSAAGAAVTASSSAAVAVGSGKSASGAEASEGDAANDVSGASAASAVSTGSVVVVETPEAAEVAVVSEEETVAGSGASAAKEGDAA